VQVKSAFRRLSTQSAADGQIPILAFKNIVIDKESRRVTVNDSPVELTSIEFDLLYTLAENKGRVLSREQLLEKVWGGEYFGEMRVVDVHLGHVRQKLGKDGFIVTVRGVGYRFEDEPL
jgi:two-component system alkaline phosphatase synthesis response regulator PhoP